MSVEFGIFDHFDDNGIPLVDLFETRLKLIEQYDRVGFRSYHIAEHHSTPLGMAPSPSVFLAAVAQRTKRIRFGPLLYITPMYHPLRLAEEVVMLDHMSNGRFELGLGRGASPIEIATFGIDPVKAPEINREATDIVLNALTSDVLDYDGKYYKLKTVRIAARPLQRPHPPLWFAPLEPSRAADAARLSGHIVTLVSNGGAKAITDAYRNTWQAAKHSDSTMPLMGVFRHVVRRRERRRGARNRPCWLSNVAEKYGVPLEVGRHRISNSEGLSGRIRGASSNGNWHCRNTRDNPQVHCVYDRHRWYYLFRRRHGFWQHSVRCRVAVG
jgi:alkanesulfonate monooxygenase SsuD/methylene tetrahydromethanopterin reductase-like flavin-dependent oxidoreductase (luciferase family)